MAMNMIVIQLLLSLSLISVYLWIIKRRSRPTLITNWPVLGMTPALFKNYHRVHDFATSVLKESQGTYQFKGPLFANMDMLFTSDPANINYILTKNFSNFPKGPEFRKIFDILGDGIFNTDGDLWEFQRRITTNIFNHADFKKTLQHNISQKVEKGLIPVLDYMCKHEIEVDLQEIFLRFTLDNICLLLLDHDPQSLSVDLPYIPFANAFTVAEEAIYFRHVLPERIWKLQRWIGLGKEKGLTKAWEAAQEFTYKCISKKNRELLRKNSEQFSAEEQENKLNSLTAYMDAYKGKTGDDVKFLTETMLNLLIAGRTSTSTAFSWFFWLLSENPSVESKILQEIETILHPAENEISRMLSNIEDWEKLVYLHGALCESLRLFPPIPLNHKAPQQPDILPSGHRVDENSKIVLSFYSMGRMETIWGTDCLEFKPERWITERGQIKHIPSYKFPAFNAGPRTCSGKEMVLRQMKMVATSIIQQYKIQVVKGHPIVPADSIILQMKYGLKVKLAKRSVA